MSGIGDLANRHVLRPLQHATAVFPWFGPAISAVVIALAVNTLSDTLFLVGGTWLAFGTVFGLLVLAMGFAIAFTQRDHKRRRSGIAFLPEDVANPSKHRGLVVLFSQEATLREAVEYHQPELRNCWLVTTPEMQERAEAEAARLQAQGVHPDIRRLPSLYDTRRCYEIVRDIIRNEAPSCGLSTGDLACDITGGTKPMSVGMMLASLELGATVEHVPTRFEAGKPTGALPPIEIRLPQQGGMI